jgi:hypothetical protein
MIYSDQIRGAWLSLVPFSSSPEFSTEVTLVQPRHLFSATRRVVGTVVMALVLLVADAWAGPRYKMLHAFGAGGGLYGSLILDATGNLYGESWGGGVYNYGTVFELSPSGNNRWKKRILHSFNWRTDGNAPYGGLIFDAGGNPYGTTSENGTNSQGAPSSCPPLQRASGPKPSSTRLAQITTGLVPVQA